MNILQVHNCYVHEGGEEHVVEAERSLLARHGHGVEVLEVQNRDLVHGGVWRRIAAGGQAAWNAAIYREVRRRLRRSGARIVHCHNIFPRVSPSVYYAARAEGVPVVQTLHNYRLLCLNGVFLREGRPCRDCSGRLPLAGVLHKCYRGSLAGSIALAGALSLHRMASTWSRCVAAYVALSEHSRAEFIAGGLPESKLFVRPNFVEPDPMPGLHKGAFALYAGRLSEEKGIRVLLRAWEALGRDIPLHICGSGPLEAEVLSASRNQSGVVFRGFVPRSELMELMHDARLLVVPSVWDEQSPLTLLQALATGLPSIVSHLGALRELAMKGPCGWTFPPGDVEALRRAVLAAWSAEGEWHEMSRRARAQFMAEHSAAIAYDSLLGIYERARGERLRSRGAAPKSHTAPEEKCHVSPP